ncbi:Asparagine synthetase [glutamine-hydrolyzing] [hydrothermal vent metagenome]|uniref:Asparagine synthetase [glutamine-hydrolyzing] n=1 Tax=hydrothermal vent metagenome TaxID=652676 RepID=A0A3B1CG66_9ZZZZ
MCGIVGLVETVNLNSRKQLGSIARCMADTIHHRGPDDSGVWADADCGLALGHRRLSIFDLSDKGAQPMVSHSGRYVIAYNGEVYNFLEIRKDLEKDGLVNWRGRSDTEVILASIERWGLSKSLTLFNGMFAFALWDRRDRVLSFARDRIGKKPLYYGWAKNAFVFGSELKAIKAHPGFEGEIDREALTLLLKHNYVPSPYSIYKNISKLPPASLLSINLDKLKRRETPSPSLYWRVDDVVSEGAASPLKVSEDEAADELEKILQDSVSLRMLSDVPLGALLSGGVDSSLVVSLMQSQSERPVKTFTIGYFEKDANEAHHAKEVANHLGTDHTELYLEPEDVLNVIPKLPELFDEPLGDTAMIPTYLVSRLARKDVTVCLSGDGGDEFFAGYPRYVWCQLYWNLWNRRFGWAPRKARMGLAKGLRACLAMTPQKQRKNSFCAKINDVAKALETVYPEQIYELLFHWKNPQEAVLNSHTPQTVLTDQKLWLNIEDPVSRMAYLDIKSRLPDSILAKVDRASMSVSLEVRAPLVDHRVMEFSARIPTSMKVKGVHGKWLLRKLLYKYVPQEMVDRPKTGFSMPINVWLRGPLRDWAESLLDERRLREEGFFDTRVVREKWKEHLSGEANWHYQLWDVLMFQAWLDN